MAINIFEDVFGYEHNTKEKRQLIKINFVSSSLYLAKKPEKNDEEKDDHDGRSIRNGSHYHRIANDDSGQMDVVDKYRRQNKTRLTRSLGKRKKTCVCVKE